MATMPNKIDYNTTHCVPKSDTNARPTIKIAATLQNEYKNSNTATKLKSEQQNNKKKQRK